MSDRVHHYHNVPAARRLRQRLTRSEELLWDELRNRRFFGLKFRRQHPVGAFVLDFLCEERLVAIEIDGGIHAKSDNASRDMTRQEAIEQRGIRFFRVSSEAVENDMDGVLTSLAAFIPLGES